MNRAGGEFRILIYGEYFLPVVGGVQTAMHLLAKGLAGLEWRQHGDSDACHIEVTVVTRTQANGMEDSSLPYRVVRRPALRQLIKLIRETDVVHVAGPCLVPMAIAWMVGKPFVVEHHGYQVMCPNGLFLREPSQTICPGYFGQRKYGECVQCVSATSGLARGIRSLLLTFPRLWLCRTAAANITITDHVAARLKLPRSHTIYYGIESLRLSNGETSAWPSGPLTVAYVGRLVPEKGLMILARAAQILADEGHPIELTFIGDGPERSRLQDFFVENARLKGMVTFAGDLRGAYLERAVDGVAIVVMPSLWEETAGLSAIEQMMRGRVVIAADIGGLAEVVGDAALKFAPGDARALACCIQKVMRDPALIRSLGSAARDRAMRLFKRDRMIRDHALLYQGLCRRPG